MRTTPCPDCRGARLNGQAMSVKLNRTTIQECLALSIAEAVKFVDGLELTQTQRYIAEEALKEPLKLA